MADVTVEIQFSDPQAEFKKLFSEHFDDGKDGLASSDWATRLVKDELRKFYTDWFRALAPEQQLAIVGAERVKAEAERAVEEAEKLRAWAERHGGKNQSPPGLVGPPWR